ncbi:hypothetical protein PFTANZ_00166 [Plasmodium falciparum Tanzania (2000708)]|uniref:Surface antigen n=1 Tax=Plasmodium falciparum Tanzania (2000708) TaxID=1036725 RepID=A0A024WET3_PLAFA|nr:hypothetical protein PFTANZ_00166 [Plasmodium falciparum Tanzania (2000708)]
MMLNYTNILLFYLSLNILSSSSEVYNQRNHYITRTPKATTRTLCECELYAPSNYDNDPEMKAVMQGFDRQTSQRFEEYNERLLENKQKCREQCDKEIQKIILKDKIEKELAEKFVTLQTDISINDLPTCVCEKSLADKVEKGCLKCAGVLGGGITPGWGLISGIVYTGWKAAALAAATKEAIAEGTSKGLVAGAQAGIKTVMDLLGSDLSLSIQGIQQMGLVINATSYTDVPMITEAIYTTFGRSCLPSGAAPYTDFCNLVWSKFVPNGHGSNSYAITNAIKKNVETIVSEAKTTVGRTIETVTKNATTTLTAKNTGEVNATYMGYQTPIIASIVAILVIVLVMIIIYLFLRYRRKKKMKKKHQYIKLLKE